MQKEVTNAQTAQYRRELQLQINENKVNIDKSVFIKSESEKLQLKEMKLKKNLAKGFTE